MPTPTYTLIASSTVGSGGAASIDFTSIPSTYTDLQILVSGRGSTGGTRDLLLAFNGSSSSFTCRYIYGNGSTVTSSTATTWQAEISSSTNTASTFGSAAIYIPNYAGSTNKSISSDSVTETNAATGVITWLSAGLWSNTAAINQITLTLDSGTFVQYSTAYLFGIRSS